MNSSKIGAVIVAAGKGTRFGGDKILHPLLGRSLLYYTVRAFEQARTVDEIVLVVRRGCVAAVRGLIRKSGFQKVTSVILGGARREESVRKGLAALSADANYFSIHDGARPLISPEQLDEIHQAALQWEAVCAGSPMYDTVQQVDGDGVILRTVDRSRLMCAATPQVFSRRIYESALEKCKGKSFTDDAGMVCAAGYPVRMVPCARSNIKVTESADIAFAAAFLAENKIQDREETEK